MQLAIGIQCLASAFAGAMVVLCGIALRRVIRKRRAAMAGAAADGDLHAPGAIALVGHELRTPLAALTGMLELLSRSRNVPDEMRRTLMRASASASTMRALLDDLLEMSRPAAERFALRPVPTDIPVLLDDIVASFIPMAVARGLRILWPDSALPRGDRTVRHLADPVRVRQILGNLLANAIRFGAGQPVAVWSQLQRIDDTCDRLTVRISDRGAGIDPQDKARLFAPFARGRRQAGGGGTGLGLYIARTLARRMGGDVTLDSAPGTETTATMTLTLLREPPPSAEATVASSRPATAGLAGALALVVDDHPAGRALLVGQLKHLGVACLAAADADEAIAMWQRHGGRIQVLVTDCMLPGTDGFAMTRRIRALETARGQLSRMPILGYSADGRPSQWDRAADAGMDGYLVKPLDIDMLGAALHRALRTVPRPETGARNGSCGTADGAADDAPNGFDEPRVVDMLLSANRADLSALVQAARDGDLDLVHTIVHRLSGVAHLAGADAVARHCTRLASACEKEDLLRVRAGLPALVHAVDYWDRALRIRRDGAEYCHASTTSAASRPSTNSPTSRGTPNR